MAIVSFSPRKYFDLDQLSQDIGPGFYHVEKPLSKKTQSFQKGHRFQSSKLITPGPGSYIKDSEEKLSFEQSSILQQGGQSSFKSKTERFSRKKDETPRQNFLEESFIKYQQDSSKKEYRQLKKFMKDKKITNKCINYTSQIPELQ